MGVVDTTSVPRGLCNLSGGLNPYYKRINECRLCPQEVQELRALSGEACTG